MAAGLAAGFLLYYRDRNSGIPLKFRRIMLVFRSVVITLISFLLMSPMLRLTSRSIEKPLIIFAQDNSRSITALPDSSFYKNEYPEMIRKMQDELSGDFELRTFTFGEMLSDTSHIDFSENATAFSPLFDELKSRFANRNIGALILASDGIYNKGSDPLHAAGRLNYPVYTIAMGDTNIRRDVIVSKVNYNRIAYLGNSFPVEVIVNANRCSGASANLSLTLNGNMVSSKPLSITDDRFTSSVVFMADATRPGVMHYRISASSVSGEVNTDNNSMDIYIEVLDARDKVLILAGAPHPDVAALKQSVEGNRNYEAEVVMLNDFSGTVNQYGLVILHQVPFRGKPIPEFLRTSNAALPSLLYILGANSDLQAFNSLKSGVSVLQTISKSDDAHPLLSTDFSLFTPGENIRRMLNAYPPLSVPFAEYRFNAPMQTLFYQKIGNVPTSKPLLTFNTVSQNKTGVLCGEGIWRWRLHNYMINSEHEAFDDIVNRILQYLGAREDRSRFRIYCENVFGGNEPVVMEAEVYNDAYEAVNDADVELVITGPDGKKYNYTFGRSGKGYYLQAGLFPPGEYTYIATVKTGGKLLSKSGMFSVSRLNLEYLSLTADHRTLFNLANSHNGEMLYPADISLLPAKIKAREDIKAVSYTHRSLSDLVNLFWVLLLILLLIGAEWVMRKMNGTY